MDFDETPGGGEDDSIFKETLLDLTGHFTGDDLVHKGLCYTGARLTGETLSQLIKMPRKPIHIHIKAPTLELGGSCLNQ